jgi:hypothetical protein
MRDRSNTVSPMTQIDTGVEVSIGRMATLPATEGFFVSLPSLSEPTAGAGEAGSGWVQQNDRHALNCRQQVDPASKITPAHCFHRSRRAGSSKLMPRPERRHTVTAFLASRARACL